MTDRLGNEILERRPVLIASNRGPVTFQLNQDGEIELQRGEGGLVTALSGAVQQVDAVWLSCAITEEDRKFRSGLVPLTEQEDNIRVRFIVPDEDAFDGYYNVIANPLLWFLQHSMWNVPHAPVIDRNTWQAWENGYVNVNRLFAQAILRELATMPRSTLVMLQDYHLYLAAHYLRSSIPPRRRPSIVHYIHIPWPGPEYWGLLPPTMRQAILEGLCAVDLLGFQTRDDGWNFIRTCEAYLPRASVKFKPGRVWYRNHSTHVRDFPISIDVDALKHLSHSPEVLDYQAEISDLICDCKLLLRIDRIEPSKNIVRGFQAFDSLLELYPEHRENVMFLALLVPSRMGVDEYKDYLDVLMATAGNVNAKYGTSEWEPIRIIVGSNYPRAIAALKVYDELVVNAIADGMNLVAKEGPVVNTRDGVLILSERAGARQQLEPGALVISPCDVYSTAEAMHQALIMPQAERRERVDRMRWIIEKEDINQWLRHQLETVDDLNL